MSDFVAWSIALIFCSIHITLLCVAQSRRRDSAFWAGFWDGITLRILWDREAIERETHERVGRMLDRIFDANNSRITTLEANGWRVK